MLTSMTGYGRASLLSSCGKMIVEIQSLNQKFLESFIILPKELMEFEVEIRKRIAQEIIRGQISVRITFSKETNEIKDLLPELSFLKKLKMGWEHLANELGRSKDEVTLPFLAKQVQMMSFTQDIKDEKGVKKILFETVQMALKELILMKQKEGAILAKDLRKRILHLRKCIEKVKERAPLSPLKYSQKLKLRLQEFTTDSEIDERILREIAIFSEKVDITEEIVRFDSHLEQFSALLESSEQAVGKKMEFLIQELVREMNTIAAKSGDVMISKMVIEIKTGLETVREQVRNIQ